MNPLVQQAIDALSMAGEKRDPYTAMHQSHTGSLASRIGTQLGLVDADLECVEMAGILHDIGKLGVPIDILSKPGTLDREERDIVKRHSRIGYEIVKGISFPSPIAECVLDHHECLDGSGYPEGKKGDEISLFTRIISVADIAEALMSHRPYRPGRSIGDVSKFLREKAGIQLDEAVVGACIAVLESP